jgi:hypothetical protein
VSIADHLWDLFDRMAAEMGTDRDGLVNQAMHQFARQNGYPSGAPAVDAPALTPRPSPADEERSREDVAHRVLETAAVLERLLEDAPGASHAPPPLPTSRRPRQLYVASGDALDKVGKDRFLIGRGKHCDFVIESGKVSREHAAIVHEGDDFFIEDLGSSNGTWHDRQRIQRRRIADGDEYFICAEKIRCLIR